jgi:hypothetical protein
MSNEPEFPTPIRMKGRLYWRRNEIESYKRNLIAYATGAPIPDPEPLAAGTIETFVTSEQVSTEFGFGRRTLGRRIAGRPITEAA